SCVYCQLGRTKAMASEPAEYYDPADIRDQVVEKVDSASKAGERIDYLTFVADGEPTLDIHLGREIGMIRSAGIRVAVITNSSLIWRESVQENLLGADWVSVKIDSVQETPWRRINRPHRSLDLRKILDGIQRFRGRFQGTLVTETMLVRDLNDSDDQISAVSEFIGRLPVDTSYLSVPIRPPAERGVEQPSEETLVRAHQIMSSRIGRVEFLIGYEGNAFALTGDAEKDILSITAVHPMREDAVAEFLKKAKSGRSVVDRLVDRDLLVRKEFQGHIFYARRLYAPRDNEKRAARME
ncbi:radical SAM protein, partial [bacterium]|nr:radical SAM protein [bacterium]